MFQTVLQHPKEGSSASKEWTGAVPLWSAVLGALVPHRFRTARGFGLGPGLGSRRVILIPAKTRKSITAAAAAVFMILLLTMSVGATPRASFLTRSQGDLRDRNIA
uniref:Uncharacterized protein n=1 Tax=Citrifermentans bremense TaxID=60035 RepID=A0A6S6LVW7_9BACT